MSEPTHEPLHERAIVAVGHQYEIEGELGRGGMSVVYRARDTRLNRPVAIKVLPPELAFDPAVRARFTREAQTAAQLAHPHIVPIYDVGERDGMAYLVMALVPGGSLAALLAQDPRPPVDEVRRILREVADALAYAHARGVIHRDIKPDNILVDPESGRAMVTDFGIARAIEAGTSTRLTVTGVAVGTPTYMSPEQAVGEREVDGRSDLYSLGVVGYQMLVGRVPFSAGNSMAILLKHVSEQPPPIAELRPDAPRALREAIERALIKSPDDRWPTAASFRDALAGIAAAPWRQERREPVRYTSPRPDGARRGAASRETGQGPVRAVSPRGGSPAAPTPSPAPAVTLPALVNGVPVVPEPLASLTAEQRLDLRVWHGRVELRDRISAVRGYAWLTAATTVTAAVCTVAGLGEGIPPAILLPAVPIYMWMKLWRRGKSLQASGLRLRRVFLSPLARWVLPPAPPSAEKELEALVPREVLDGPHGAAVRRAVAERAAVFAIVAQLPEPDRDQLPELAPTVNLLVERVAHLARAAHGLDGSIDPHEGEALDARVAELEQAATSPERDRQLELVRRQRERLDDLAKRRAELLHQLESASLALGGLRLDLAKLRASGLPSAIADLSAATQEARALSRDIGVVLEAATEVGRL
jgi:serine/threonine-protein kinase